MNPTKLTNNIYPYTLHHYEMTCAKSVFPANYSHSNSFVLFLCHKLKYCWQNFNNIYNRSSNGMSAIS